MKDPFSPSSLVPRKDKAPPSDGEFQFYYYFHRPTQRMILRIKDQSFIVDDIQTIGIDTWLVRHTVRPLKFIVSGIAKHINIDNERAVLS